MKRLALHWQILIGMVLGLLFGISLLGISGGKEFIGDWISPFGTIFINLLKLIAIPLILASIIKGISDLKDISKFRDIGLRSVVIFILTTIIAISIGLVLVNVFSPGKGISQDTVDRITLNYAEEQGVQSKLVEASVQKELGPLQFLIDMVPDNVFSAM
ncbi:MAG TPA: cation:dicarboxylase symporter family transporter, partial [Arenibacter sp.]|nr:cation:dicarboxylase symporter family transporter [Arenibacter sp.]